MAHLRQSAWRRVQAVCLVALLLVPLALRGHGHAGHTATARSCSVCLATAHTPALAGAPVGCATPLLRDVAAVFSVRELRGRLDRPTQVGRAPPRVLPVVPVA